MSFTMLAPARNAARATAGFCVSMETGASASDANSSTTGSTRLNSSASLTGSAPGRVDSPPTSMISAPWAISFRPCATAVAGSMNWPPSENESGVTFTTPMIIAGRGNWNSNWRARKIMVFAAAPARRGRGDGRPFRIHTQGSTFDQLLRAIHQPPRDGADQFVRHAHPRIRALAQHVALVVDVINQYKFTGPGQRDFTRKKPHAGHLCDPVDDVPQRRELKLLLLCSRRQPVPVRETIPPAAPHRAEHVKHAKVNRLAVLRLRNDKTLQQIVPVRPRRHRARDVFFARGIHDDSAPAVAHGRLDHERRAKGRAVRFRQKEAAGLLARNDHRERQLKTRGQQPEMQPRLVERGQRDVRRIDDLCLALVRQPYQPVIDVVGKMMLAVHVEQRPRPDLALGQLIAKRFDPERFDEKKVQAQFRAMLLDAMDEQVIRVQLVGHHQVVNPRHAGEYSTGKQWLSITWTSDF